MLAFGMASPEKGSFSHAASSFRDLKAEHTVCTVCLHAHEHHNDVPEFAEQSPYRIRDANPAI
jgi:hypothetical protein